MSEIDLSGFPILRIDQISYIDTPTLIKSQIELEELSNTLDKEKDKNLIKYIKKQFNDVSKEISLRNSAEEENLSKNSEKSDLFHSETQFEDKNKFKPLPLPSELARNDTNLPSSMNTINSSEHLNSNLESIELLSSRSNNETIIKSTNNKINRPLSSENPAFKKNSNQISSKRPSRKSVQAINNNFSNSFIVAAVEKKKRFYPTKPKMTEAQLMEEKKTERRKAAMARLMARREEREKVRMKKKEIKRQKSLKSPISSKLNSENLYPSSESESVSGGDDEVSQNKDCNPPIIEYDDNKENPVELKRGHLILIDQSQENKRSNDETGINSQFETTDLDVYNVMINPNESNNTVNIPLELQNRNRSKYKLNPESFDIHKEIENECIHNIQETPIDNINSIHDKENMSSTTEEIDLINNVPEIVGESANVSEQPIIDNKVESDMNEDLRQKNLSALMTLRSLKSKRNQIMAIKISKDIDADADADEKIMGFDHDIDSESLNVDLKSNMTKELSSDKNYRKSPSMHEVQNETVIKFQDISLLKAIETNKISKVLSIFQSNPLISIFSLKENPESFSDLVFNSQFGPDFLPGLLAWKLDMAGRTGWVLDIDEYKGYHSLKKSRSTSDLFERKSFDNKNVLLGLLLLVDELKDILMGNLFFESSDMFKTEWRLKVNLFDDRVSQFESSFVNDLMFKPVNVSGKLYAICKKVESIMKASIDNFQNTNDQNSKRRSTSIEAASDKDENIRIISSEKNLSISKVPLSSPECVFTQILRYQQGDRVELKMDNEIAKNLKLDLFSNLEKNKDSILNNYEVSSFHSREEVLRTNSKKNKNDEPEISHFPSIPATQAFKDELYDNDDDDDESILPMYANKIEFISDKSQNVKDNLLAEKNPLTQPKSVRLMDYYPHIGCIIPVANGFVKTRHNNEDGNVARKLIESIQFQIKVYEEWHEIMSDYSTVFSEEKENRDKIMECSNEDNKIYQGGSKTLHFRVKSAKPEVFNIVSDVFNKYLKNWEDLPSGLGLGLSWNLLWTWSKPKIDMSHLLIWQKVNHFVESKQLTRKDLLKKNLQKYTDMTGKFAAEFIIMPQSFLLPGEYTSFVQAFMSQENAKDASVHNYWIMKPVGLSRGRGISVVKDLNEISYSQTSVIQKYIENPLLLNSYKFDLRLYILVTSFKPLEAFIYKEGFARVSTHAYSLDEKNVGNKFIHLTNSSIQKQNIEGPTKDNPLSSNPSDNSDDGDDDTGGSKIALLGKNGLWSRLIAMNIDTDQLWKDICTLIVKSLVVVDEKIPNQPCCFELFGYDVIIDSNHKPWLLEVNSSPSLARPSQLDYRIKECLIKDIVELLDPAPFDRSAIVKVLKRRLNDIIKNRVFMKKNDPMLENDLKEILGDYVPRKYGEIPKNIGNFEMLCPGTKSHQYVLKLKSKIIKTF